MSEQETSQVMRQYQGQETKDEKQFVVFALGKETYGINISQVREIITMQELTTIPKSAAHIKGVINLRGKVIPVFNLAGKLGFAAGTENKDTRIVVVEVRGIIVGMIVDAVSEVMRLPGSVIEAPSGIMTGISEQFIEGIAKYAKSLIIILNLNNVLIGEEIELVG